MTSQRAYLDHNAATPLRPAARDAMVAALAFGNPSSIHAEGRRARARIEAAREAVAALVGARPDGVVFTSGGTEANAAALRPGALRTPDGRPVARLVAGATEHPSVLAGHGFAPDAVALAPVDRRGVVDGEALDRLLAESDAPTVVSVALANGETGVVQDVPALVALARRRCAAFHVDAVQAAGRFPVDMAALGVDALGVSAHKLGGAPGAGALCLAPGRAGPARPLVGGGGQERGFRGGTENAPAIAAFGAAAAEAARDLPGEPARLRALRDAAEAAVRRLAPDVVVFGAGAERAPGTLAFAVPGVAAETALVALDLAGVAVSSGSACSSGVVGRSHVLAAMGVPAALAAGALRLSFGWPSTHEDVSRFVAAFASVLRRLYEGDRARAA